MKKLLLTALICAPVIFQAQTKPAVTPAAKDPAQKESPRYNVETMYSELIIAENQNKISLRLDFGQDLMTNLTDKESIAQIEQMRTMQFTSVADVLNYAASAGWKMTNSYSLNRATGSETHIVLEKRLMRKPGADGKGGVQPPVERPVADPAARPANPGVQPVPPAKERSKG
ncbi:MAG: hypothetical protein JNM00_00945 [Flavobacteriales bacterium]|nr:hypothetical protein [Flavobacteriales bacterium]